MSKCKEKAETQPHFILLAQDNLSCDLVALWIRQAETMGATTAKVEQAKRTLANMQRWRSENFNKCQYPD